MLITSSIVRRLVVPQGLIAATVINASTLGAPGLVWPQVVAAELVANESLFGAPAIALPAVDRVIDATAVVNLSAFGQPAAFNRLQFLAVSRVENASSFGEPSIVGEGEPQVLQPATVVNVSAFGAPSLIAEQYLAPLRVENASEFCAPAITNRLQLLTASRVANASNFGAPTIEIEAAPSYSTFDPLQKNRYAVLSNSNLTLGYSGGAAAAVGAPADAGKLYFEVSASATFQYMGVGVVDEDSSFSASIGGGAYHGAVLDSFVGDVYLNNAQQSGKGVSFGANDVVQVAVDLDARLFWVRKNGTGDWNTTSGADPASGTGGISLATLGAWILPYVWVSAANNQSATANFGGSAFAYTPPAGFSGWPAKTDYTHSTFTAHTKASTIALSNGDLTVTSGAAATQMARALWHRFSGKYYFEVTVGATGGTFYAAGLAIGGTNFARTFGNAASGVANDEMCWQRGGNVYVQGSSVPWSFVGYGAGDVLSIAVDFDNPAFWLRKNGGDWNGDPAADPATNANGRSVPNWARPHAPAWGTNGNGDSATFNFGASAFAYTAPSGFTAGWPV